MYRFRNSVAVLLIAAFMVLIMPQITAEEAENNSSDKPVVLFKYTGDLSADTGWANQIGSCKVEKTDNEHGNALRLDTSAQAYALINQSEAITSGKVVLSWDFKTNTDAGMTYIRLFSDFHKSMSSEIEDDMFEMMMWYKDGRVGPFKNFNGWSLDSQTKKYSADTWMHYDVWIDIAKKNAELYLDGELLATVSIVDEFKSFCGFVIAATNDGKDVTDYVDNVYIGYVPSDGYKPNFDFCRYIPSDIESSVVIGIKSPQIGNVYFGKDIKFDANLKNPYDKERNLSFEYRAVTDTGRTAKEYKYDVTLNPLESKNVDVQFDVGEYGFYHIYFSVTDKETNEIISKETRFSALNHANDIGINKKQGLNVHFTNNRGTDRMEDLVDMYANAGFGILRENINYNHVYGFNDESPTAFTIPDFSQRWLESTYKNGQTCFVIFSWATLLFNKGHLPTSSAEREAWKGYVRDLALYASKYGNRDFELHNEINLRYNSGIVSPEIYVQNMKDTYEVLHQYLPDSRLFVFSTANVKAVEFMEECLKLGCKDYMDGVTIHPYNALSRPDEGKLLTDVEDTQKLLEKYGAEDKPIIFSEFGWTSGANYVSEDEQAMYTVRGSALAYDSAESIIWYNDIEKVDQTEEGEIHFGMLRGFRGQDINYEAKPVFAAMSNYNALMNNATSNGTEKIFDNGGYICKFKARDNSDIYMIWKIRDSAELKLDIGADSATIYDFYGNSNRIKTENGILNLSVSEHPQYVKGNFSKCTEIKQDGFEIETDKISIIENDSAKLTILNKNDISSDNKYDITVDLPNNISIDNETGFVDGKACIRLKVGKKTSDDEKIRVFVTDKSKNIIWYKQIDVEYTEAISSKFMVKYYKSGKWQGVLNVTNNKNDGVVSGVFKVNSPTELSKYVENEAFENLLPKATHVIKFNIPDNITFDHIDIDGEIVLNDGLVTKINESSYFTSLMPITAKPQVDGVIFDGEYNVNAPLLLNKERMVTPVPGTTWNWSGTSDLSARGYINYDKDYFYLAFDVTDNNLGDNDEQERIWANDSIQFAFAKERKQGSGRTEIGIGLINGQPKIERYSFMAEKQNILWLETEGKKEGFNEDTELAIKRNAKHTVYELKISWEDIFGTKIPFSLKDVFFALIINENDGNGRMGWLEFSPGIGSVKNETLFTKVPVSK